jgi:cysteine desulfurase
MAYFDWNATAPLLPQARDAWLEATETAWANPSTAYRAGVSARLALDEARARVGEIMNRPPEQVIFTSGATESNNGLLREAARRARPDGLVWISAVEHPSVTATAETYWGRDRVVRIPVSRAGVVDLDWIRDHLKTDRPELVSVMAANNETGVLQPWQIVRNLCREVGVAFHCDAAQWIGKCGSSYWNGCAGVTLSGHKFGGPRGVGCLVLDDEWKGLTVQAGGAQEMDMRSGTENLPAILGMVAALVERDQTGVSDAVRQARDDFEKALLETWGDAVVIHGAGVPRLWNTCSVALPEFPSSRWISRLDRLGFAVSSGSACSTGKDGPSPVLAAMGVNAECMRRTLRISGGWETAPSDWEALREALVEVRTLLSSEDTSSGPGKVIEI